MTLRLIGLKEEQTFNTYPPIAVEDNGTPNVDFHQQSDKIDFTLGMEPLTNNGGSNQIQDVRGGYAEPSGETEGLVDLKRIGHYLKGVLGGYNFQAGESGAKNKHEFWGTNSNKLPSWSINAVKDIYQQAISGACMDEFKLEAKKEFMSQSIKWSYSNERRQLIDPDEWIETEVDGAIPLVGYDVEIQFLKDGTNTYENPPGVITELSLEIKNNLNTDKTSGLNSRFPVRKPSTQQREVSLKLNTTLDIDTFNLVTKSAYGELTETDGWYEPSKCKVYSSGIKITMKVCEDTSEQLVMIFPDCIFTCTDSTSGSDEIEVEIEVITTGRKTITSLNGSKKTDIYCVLQNSIAEIRG